MTPVDVKTIRMAQKGDEKAFDKLYQEYYYRVFYYALKLCKSDADAKDITQETFIQIHKSIKDLRKPEYFPLWVNRIIHSKFHRQLKKYKETPIDEEDLIFYMDAQEEQETDPILNDADVFLQMIDSLTPKQSEVLRMMYYYQYTSKEIADALHLPEGTAKSRIHQAKSALKQKILAFEKREGRKLTFRADIAGSLLAFPLFLKLKDLMQNSSTFTQATLVASTVSTVVIATTAVTSTAQLLKQEPVQPISKPVEKVKVPTFQPTQYQTKTVDNAKSAYYTLMAWAPDVQHVTLKSAEEKKQIESVVQNLKDSNSSYYQQLVNSGWIHEFY